MYNTIKEYVSDAEGEGLVFSSSGTSNRKGKEAWLSLVFKSKNPMTIQKARTLTVELSKKLVDKINNNPELRNYLVTYPIGTENVEVSFLAPINVNDPENSVSATWIHKGRIYYRKENPEDTFTLVGLHEETFEEAQAIVEKEKENQS